MRPTPPVPPDFQTAVLDLLRTADDNLPDSWLTMQRVHNMLLSAGDRATCSAQQLLQPALDALHAEKPLLAKTLRLRYRQGLTVREVGRKTHRAPATVLRDINAGHKRLSRILWQQEFQAREHFSYTQQQRLEPPTYQKLFGVDAVIKHLQTVLEAPDGPQIILLTGAGGLGKTSLADYLSRQLITHRTFRGFGWVSLRPQISLWDTRPYFQAAPQQALEHIFEHLAQQLLGNNALPSPFSLDAVIQRLQAFLHQAPHFIVIDNLETLAVVTPLLARLQQLPADTRVLITSRVSYPHQPGLYLQKIPALEPDAALQLLRHQGEQRNISALLHADDADLRQLYRVAGGNPLALKLIAGQLHTRSLPTVLEDLTQARTSQTQRLYDYLYRRAWEHLSATTRQIFLAMLLLPPEGGTRQQLSAITNLPESIVLQALETLIRQNLIQHHQAPEQSLYALHSLTRAFLQQQTQSLSSL